MIKYKALNCVMVGYNTGELSYPELVAAIGGIMGAM